MDSGAEWETSVFNSGFSTIFSEISLTITVFAARRAGTFAAGAVFFTVFGIEAVFAVDFEEAFAAEAVFFTVFRAGTAFTARFAGAFLAGAAFLTGFLTDFLAETVFAAVFLPAVALLEEEVGAFLDIDGFFIVLEAVFAATFFDGEAFTTFFAVILPVFVIIFPP